MRFKDAPKLGKQFQTDLQETIILRSVQDELEDRANAALWKTIPDAKVAPRANSQVEKHALDLYGLGCLSDVVASCDLLSMRRNDELPKMNDGSLYAELMVQLHEVPRQPDIKSSFQWLGRKSSFEDADDGVWQVQMSRRRRRDKQLEERMSRDHHEEDDDCADTHGNEIILPVEATRRMATSKELKRLKKAIAIRRRAGEADIYTDDELDKANLDPPTNKATKPKAPTTDWPPRATIQPAAARPVKRGTSSQASSSSNSSSIDSTKGEWEQIMYLEPTTGVSPVKSLDSSEPWLSDESWMTSGGSIVARVSSGSWS